MMNLEEPGNDSDVRIPKLWATEGDGKEEVHKEGERGGRGQGWRDTAAGEPGTGGKKRARGQYAGGVETSSAQALPPAQLGSF